MNTYLLAITCYNCAPQICRVLDKIEDNLASQFQEIMIIDNRSTDQLEETVRAYLEQRKLENVHLYKNIYNYSLGGSHKVAFNHAKKMDASHVVVLHGDDQADPHDIPPMLQMVEQGDCNTVLGSRFNKKSILSGYDFKRIVGNRTLNKVFSIFTGRHVEDLGSGLNVFALSDMDESRYLNFADRLTFNIELLLDLIDRKVKYEHYPIHWSETDQVSNARNISVAWTAFKNLLSWRFARNRFFGGNAVSDSYKTIRVI